MVGVNQQNMNGTNKFLVLKTIATQGPVSRVEISRKTGLSKMTVTTLVGEYLQEGIVRECGLSNTPSGRKPRLLEAAPESLLTLGVDIGRDSIMVGIIDLCGNIRSFEHISLNKIVSKESLISSVLLMSDNVMRKENQSRIWGAGISSIGPQDSVNGVIVNPPDFKQIHDVPIVQAVQEKYNLPAYLENDMCVSALAELYYGKGKEYEHFVYIGISAGIGGGVVIDRKLYRGVRGLAGSWGHIPIVASGGLPCECGGEGCLEMYGSVRAAVRWAKKNGAPQDLTWSLLLDRANAGDAVCLAALDNMYRYLEMALLGIVNTLDVQCIFLGGEIWHAADYFVKRLNKNLQKKAFGNRIQPLPVVRLSQFSANASFVGTAALVMENNLGNCT